jgi:antirestriction protein ArdC
MAKHYDKEQWLDDAKVRVEAAKQALEAGLAALQTSEDWKRTLQAMAALGPARLGRLSFRNALLVLMEKPDARHVATFATWRKLGRGVRKGEKSLTILQPRFAPKGEREAKAIAPSEEPGQILIGFKPLSVFALQQTDGPELPVPRTEKELETPEGFLWGVAQLQKVALGMKEVSEIQLRPRGVGDPARAHGWYTPTTRQIVIVTGESSQAMQLRTLCHEVAHALLHPVGDHHSTPEREVEAESTAFVVCHSLGLDTSDVSFPYVAEWSKGIEAEKQLAQTGQRILTAATRLLEVMVPEATAQQEAA